MGWEMEQKGKQYLTGYKNLGIQLLFFRRLIAHWRHRIYGKHNGVIIESSSPMAGPKAVG
jgi:hypothetical protein